MLRTYQGALEADVAVGLSTVAARTPVEGKPTGPSKMVTLPPLLRGHQIKGQPPTFRPAPPQSPSFKQLASLMKIFLSFGQTQRKYSTVSKGGDGAPARTGAQYL